MQPLFRFLQALDADPARRESGRAGQEEAVHRRLRPRRESRHRRALGLEHFPHSREIETKESDRLA